MYTVHTGASIREIHAKDAGGRQENSGACNGQLVPANWVHGQATLIFRDSHTTFMNIAFCNSV